MRFSGVWDFYQRLSEKLKPMNVNFPHLSDEEAYCTEFSSPESQLLAEIARYTWTTQNYPRMLSGHLQGRLLSLISRLKSPRHILEIGTFTGYSALCLAEGLPKDGQLLTIEKNPELEEPVRAFFARSPYASQMEIHIGNALEKLPFIDFAPDLVFLDADKEEYPEYLLACEPIMQPGSILIADNVLWGGKVLHETSPDKETRGIRAFNRMISERPEWDVVMLPIRDGLLVAQKK